MIASKRTDKVSDLNYLLGVKSDGGLVKYDDFGASDKSLSDTDSLAVSL